MRRLILLFVIAGAGLLSVLWIRQDRGAERSSGAESRSLPAAQEATPAQPSELAAPDPVTAREAVSPSQPAARAAPDRSARPAAQPLAVVGRVVDDLGSPVTAFGIEATRPGDDHPERRGHRTVRAFEDAAGRFRFEGLAAGQWQLTALGRSDGRSAPLVVSIPDPDEAVLVVPRAGTISGFVVQSVQSAQSARAPVADAKVYVQYAGEPELEFDFGVEREPDPRATTGGAGEFRLEGVTPGTVELLARHPDFADAEWKKVEVAPGALVQGVEIVLSAGGRITGHVDPSLGDLAERPVSLFSFRGGFGWRDASTDSAGRFAIEHVVPQDYVIELGSKTDGAGASAEAGIRKNISVREGATTEVAFGESQRALAVRGIVTLGGAPARGLNVRPYAKANEDRGEEASTGADGRFALTLAGPGDYTFRVSANYGSSVDFDRTVPDQDGFELALEVPGGVLAGRVLDANGRALVHVPITVVRSGSTRETFYRDCYRRDYTDSDGSFRFALLAPGSYTLRAPDGFQGDSPPPRVPHGRVVRTGLELGATEVDGIELRLPVESRIAGLVVDARGNPVTGAWIGALDARGDSIAGVVWETRSDATGHFEIANVAAGTHVVRARSGEQEAKSEPFEVEAGKTASVRIELR